MRLIKRFSRTVILFATLAYVNLAAENIIIQWNQAALQAVRNTRTAPPIICEASERGVIHTRILS